MNDDASSRNGIEMTTTPGGYKLYPSKSRYDTGVSPADMPFLHHRPDYRPPSREGEDDDSSSPSTAATGGRPKFRNPRKRASKLFHQLQTEAENASRSSKPEVWTVPFKVGDAVELGILDDGGAANPNNKKLDHVRGVVLGRENKGLDTSIYLKDVLYGEFFFLFSREKCPMGFEEGRRGAMIFGGPVAVFSPVRSIRQYYMSFYFHSSNIILHLVTRGACGTQDQASQSHGQDAEGIRGGIR